MKRYIKLFSATLALFVLSCNKQLDTQPTGSLDADVALQTDADVKVALVGAYSDLGDEYMYGGAIFVESELLADFNEMNWSGTYEELTQAKNKALVVNNAYIRDTWLAGYRAINDANNVLSAIDVVNDDDQARVEAEAKFIRGSVYFDLVRAFAKSWNDGDPSSNPGVPIVLEPTREINEASQVSRSSVSAVYAQAISDLQFAEDNLPESNGVYASKAAAAAMLARIYLQQADYPNAAKEANTAIEVATSNGVSLTKNYADAFSETNSSEDIFALQVNSSSGYNTFQEFFSSLGRGDIQIKDAHLSLYESGDDRLNLFYVDGGSTYTGKFEYVYGNVHAIRLAEMYLVRAEANFRSDASVGATPVADINVIRKRAGLDAYAPGELTLSKILMERKLELAFEGFALQDKKRLQQAIGTLAWNSPKLIFPIPQREIIANPNLTQNEGYQ